MDEYTEEQRIKDLTTHPDPILALVSEFTKFAGTTVTLITAAGVITGDTISYEKYWEREAAQFKKGITASNSEKLSEEDINGITELFTDFPTQEEDDEQPHRPAKFIHLSGTTVHAGNTYQFPQLRVRLSEIIAWRYGK